MTLDPQTTRNITRKLGALRARIDATYDLLVGRTGSATGDGITQEEADARYLQEVLAGVDIHVDGNTVNRAGNRILLKKASDAVMAEYAHSGAGLTAALAAMVDGDVCELPVGTITGGPWTVSAGTVRGVSREGSVLDGQVNLSDETALAMLTVDRDEDDAGDIIAVQGPATGTAYIHDCNFTANNATGDGFAISAQSGGDVEVHGVCKLSAQSAGADSNPIDALGGTAYVLGAEEDSGAITVTSEAGHEITGLVAGNWYALEAYNGPWYNGAGSAAYGFAASNDGGTTWTLWIGTDGTLPSWASYLEADGNYGRIYFQATAGMSLYVRVGDTPGYFYDNSGSLSWRLSAATYAAGGVVRVYAVIMDDEDGLELAEPMWGDRSAWNVNDYPGRHASDLEDDTPIHHSPQPGSARNVQISDGTQWESRLLTRDDVPATGVDWNHNDIDDTADMVGFVTAGYMKQVDEPLAFIISNQRARLEDIEELGLPDVTNPIIAPGAGADSDLYIREIGNILVEPFETSRKYKMLYTGYNAGTATDEKIHYAYSEDGKTWTKYASNPVISDRAEDPYLIRVVDTYYVYVEDKANQGANGRIRRYSSSDCITWTDDGQCTGLGDAQSPLVWIEDGTWYMLYEDYPSATPDINLATSDDGMAWTPDGSNPVMVLGDTTWVQGDLVPDDLLKIGSTYYMTYHGYSTPTGGTRAGMAYSTDLTSWTDIAGVIPPMSPFTRIRTMMFCLDEHLTLFFYDEDDEGVNRAFPVLSDTTTLTLSGGAVTASKDYHVIAAESGTADDLDTISGGVDGQGLVLAADSGDTITVKHGTDNIQLNGGEDFELSGNKKLLLIYDGTNWCDVAPVAPQAHYELLQDEDGDPLTDEDGEFIYGEVTYG